MATACLAGGWLVWHSLAREPVYEGRRLGFWVEQLPLTWTVSDDLPAVKALRHIGTNAVPYLLDTVRSGYPDYKTRLGRVAAQLNRHLPFLRVRVVSEFERWNRAFHALRVLGDQARPAVPQLVVMLNTGEYSRARGDPSVEAAWVLGNIRPEGTDCLIAATTNQNVEVRRTVVEVLGANGPASRKVVSALVGRLSDEDPDIRVFAARALGNLRAAPDLAVPALLVALVDPMEEVRGAAAEALLNCRRNTRKSSPTPADALKSQAAWSRQTGTQLTNRADREANREPQAR